MCTVGGCGNSELEKTPTHEHGHAHGVTHSHPHGQPHKPLGHVAPWQNPLDEAQPEPDHPHHGHSHHLHHHGAGPAGAPGPENGPAQGMGTHTGIEARNDALAAGNRRVLNALGVFAVTLVSLPGAGKTTLLCATIDRLQGTPLAVIDGDRQTDMDTDRIRATGAQALQVNTGTGRHLDAASVGQAMDTLRLAPASLLFIENVGDQVCPAAIDLGEDARVAILSVTEGHDKPLKYPDMFAAARLAILNKTDLAPYMDADLTQYEANLRRVNPAIEIIRLSARTGEGMEAWIHWLMAGLAAKAR